MKLDVLAFGAHPDDVELACSGTMLKFISEGKSVGIIDLTKGELGTRGTEHTRKQEAADAAGILGISARENLDLGDGTFDLSHANKLRVIEMIRKYQPTLVLANAANDRHVDHPRAAQLVTEAAFLSGLTKIETIVDGHKQIAFRPAHLYHYIQHYHITPDFVVDITPHFATKMRSILAYKTQFYNPDSEEKDTPISSKRFLDFLEARCREMGEAIGVEFGEGFTSNTPLNYDLASLL
ncbi:MAG: bacillithiol biosynthesis deacetylase BshB1 [Bacteroidetes bacterium]|jgi:bacillithiol biosynthesis deacetylase BshB1|nr:bacillithiol biosynthesis deacetylase BshB1 [Bacteroidota bacterium]MDA8930472.1 bacillithiol biosynthesis deacetylase BshB1 [Bacteroidia bacterium]